MNRYEEIYRKANEKRNASWVDTAIALLACDIEKATGEPAQVSGPFGLRAEVYISTKRKSICVTPEFPEGGGLALFYDSGELADRFGPGTLGDFNGLNNVRKPLPDTIQEIVKVMHETEEF